MIVKTKERLSFGEHFWEEEFDVKNGILREFGGNCIMTTCSVYSYCKDEQINDNGICGHMESMGGA